MLKKPKEGLAHGTWRLKNIEVLEETVLIFDFWVTEACRYIGETPRYDHIGKYADFNIELPISALHFLEGYVRRNEQVGDWTVVKIEDGFQSGKYFLDTKTYIISRVGQSLSIPYSLIEFLRDHDFYAKKYPRPTAPPKLTISDALAKITELETRVKTLDEERNKLQNLARELEEKLKTLESERTKAIEELNKALTTISELQIKASLLEEKLGITESEKTKLAEELIKIKQLYGFT